MTRVDDGQKTAGIASLTGMSSAKPFELTSRCQLSKKLFQKTKICLSSSDTAQEIPGYQGICLCR
jgi:hypothetical protein